MLSGKAREALEEGAARLRQHMEAHPKQSLRDIAYTLAAGRTHHEHRLALSAGSREELLRAMEVASRGEMLDGASRGEVRGASPKVVFVFPGAGSQWLGMGLKLLEEEKVFRETFEACDDAIRKEAGYSVLEELKANKERSRLEEVEVVQPTLFAFGVSLAVLWRSWGIQPSAVVGHSQGEVAAAYVAGALSLEEAVAVICRRSRLLRRIVGQGEMAMVQLPMAQAQEAIGGYEGELSIAVSNSRHSTVLSGSPGAIAALLKKLEARGVYCKRVKVDFASHSPQVESLREELVTQLSGLGSKLPKVPMHSTVTGSLVGEGELKGEYWADNLRKPVRFGEVVEGLLGKGYSLFVEVSPHPVLVPALEEVCNDEGVAGIVVGSLRREKPERASLLASLGALYVNGAKVEWGGVFGQGCRKVELPTYAWQRKRYWVEASPAVGPRGEFLEKELHQLGTRGGLSAAERALLPKLLAALEAQRADAELSRWFYALEWQRQEVSQKAPGIERRWLLLEDEGGVAELLARVMCSLGVAATFVPRKERGGLEAILRATTSDVVCVDGLSPGGEYQVLEVLKILASSLGPKSPRCWLVTRGAVSVAPQEVPANAGQAVIWGLGRSFALECPHA